ncbi:MAG: acyl-CoA dehydratase activase-related protein [Actinomycetota bacterium]
MSKAETKPVIGMASAFTGHSRSARILETYLREVGFRVRRTPRTTPDILEAGIMLSSTEHCLPLRAYVGHVHRLIDGPRPVDVLLAPNLCSEDGLNSVCAKYRDPGDVALRSLGSAVAYAVARAGKRERALVARFLGPEDTARLVADGEAWPEILEPEVWSLAPERMEALGYRVLCRLRNVPSWRRRLAPFLLAPLADVLAPWTEARRAMRGSLAREAGRRSQELQDLLESPDRPRLGLVGREYLVEDPILTADIKSFFVKAGCAVLTPLDVPFALLQNGFDASPGYYETHRLNASFIDFAGGLPVDGFVMVSSFGCHPDAFESEWLADRARSRGIPAWYFRFDDQSGRTGFKTRFETILTFLEGERDVRLGRKQSAARNSAAHDDPSAALLTRPLNEPPGDSLVTWPSFSVAVDLALEEVFHQAGLGPYVIPPLPPTLETIALGEGKYAESCCPYGITTGSFVQTLSSLFDRLESEAHGRGEQVRPRRIFLVQGRAEGPCVYGWYSLAQAGVLPDILGERLARSGHTLEMASLGVTGAKRIIGNVAHLGDARKLKPLLACAEKGELDEVSSNSALVEVIRRLNQLIKPGRAKLEAAEEIRARALLARAHELEPGAVSRAEKAGYELLREAHSLKEIAEARRAALRLMDAVPQDPSPRPRVVCVGEIYVVHSPFASRGAMDVLLGREGIEVVPGNTIGEFVRESFQAGRRRAILRNPLVDRIMRPLWRRGVPLLAHPPNRAPLARPYLWHEVGGEGVKPVAAARKHVEQGADGVLHVYPFKCMPEGIAKDALAELCRTYGVRYLPMSFGKEADIERMRTELGTFAELLRVEMETRWNAKDPGVYAERRRTEVARRIGLGRALDACVRSAARAV